MSTADSSSPGIELLLAERAWVRRLAGALVRDAATAEDLTQDAYVAALERGPASPRWPRAWLGTVVRNLARNRHRSEARRRVREQRVDPSRGEGSPADAVARAELVERIGRLVLALDEPYRTTVVLRFFEEEPPRRIAARMDVPVETVRTRLRRALAMLKERLDATHVGGRRAWLAALVPVAKGGLVVSTASNTSIGVLLAITVAVAALLVVLWPGVAGFFDRDTSTSPLREHGEAAVEPADTAAPTLVGVDRDALEGAVSSGAVDGASALLGRVYGPGRHPANGVRVTVRLDGRVIARATTDAEGRYEVDRPLVTDGDAAKTLSLHAVTSDGRAAFGVTSLPVPETSAATLGALVLRPACDVAVRVATADGDPVTADVLLWANARRMHGLLVAARTNARGEAVLRDLPDLSYRVVATAKEHGRASRFVRVPEDAADGVRLALGGVRRVTVRVVEGEVGRPLAGIRLSVWEQLPIAPFVGSGTWSLAYRPSASVAPTDANGTTVLDAIGVDDTIHVGLASKPWLTRRGFPGVEPGSWHHDFPVPPNQDALTISLPALRTVSWPLEDGEVAVPADGTAIRFVWRTGSTWEPETGTIENGRLVVHAALQAPVRAWAVTSRGETAAVELDGAQRVGPATSFHRPRALDLWGTTEDGAPLAGGTVYAGWGRAEVGQTTLDENGRGRIEGLPPDTATLWLAGGAGGRGSVGRVDLTPGDRHHEFKVADEHEVEIHLVVNGKPRLPDEFRVWLEPGKILRTDEDPRQGAIRLHWCPEGTHRRYRLQLESPGHRAVWAWLEADTKTLELVLDRGGVIDAEVRPPPDRIHRVRVQRWHVGEEAWFGSGGRSANGRPWRTGGLDGIRVTRLAEGTYRLHDHLTGASSEPVELGTGEHATLRLDLRKAGPVRGRVEGPKGADLAKARVIHDGARGQAVNADGTFEVRVPGDRPVTLCVKHPLLPAAEVGGKATVTEPQGGVVLRLGEGGGTTLTFLAEKEIQRNVPSLRVLLFDGPVGAEPAHALTAPVTREGRRYEATVGGFPAGRWTLWIDPGQFAPVTLADVDLAKPDERLLDIPLRLGAAVHVKVLAPEGGDPPIVIVEAERTDPDRPAYGRADGDQGTEWTLRGLGSGRFKLKVMVFRDLVDEEGPPGLEEVIDLREGERIERVIDLR